MSSTYRILCLSHDPAIELDRPEWSGPSGVSTYAVAVNLASNPEDSEIGTHAGCDLLVGRFSYSLIEVCCPPPTRAVAKGVHADGGHGDERWTDVDWLRLLWEAYNVRESAGHLERVLERFSRSCWTPTRLNRLRQHLDLT